MRPIVELEGELEGLALGRLDHAPRCAAQAGMALAAQHVGGAFGIELLEGAAHDLRFVLLAVDLGRIDAVEHRRAHQVGMAAHDLKPQRVP